MPWKKALYIISGAAGVGLSVFALLPAPAQVDAGEVANGSMEVTVDDQGETRCHDRFVLAAPVSGRLMRIELHAGDAVTEGQIVAQIAALPLSVRERDEQRARITAAEALEREAAEHVKHAEDDLALARRERERVETLVKGGGLPAREAERAKNLEVTSTNELEAARFRAASAKAQVVVARSGLAATEVGAGAKNIVQLRAPVAGRILGIADASERVVTAGTEILTVADLKTLEVVIELLSSEAVRVAPGMQVWIDGWGGKAPLEARVRHVEPLAFTKVSALGVEEKRTNVVVDFVDSPIALGDGFRVTGHIVVWRGERVTKVPASALFRCGETWCAFAVMDGRAALRTVDIGNRNALEAEVLSGLRAGQKVIRHPGNELSDGDRVRIRTPKR